MTMLQYEKQVTERITLTAQQATVMGQGLNADGSLWDGTIPLAGVAETDAASGEEVAAIKGIVLAACDAAQSSLPKGIVAGTGDGYLGGGTAAIGPGTLIESVAHIGAVYYVKAHLG